MRMPIEYAFTPPHSLREGLGWIAVNGEAYPTQDPEKAIEWWVKGMCLSSPGTQTQEVRLYRERLVGDETIERKMFDVRRVSFRATKEPTGEGLEVPTMSWWEYRILDDPLLAAVPLWVWRTSTTRVGDLVVPKGLVVKYNRLLVWYPTEDQATAERWWYLDFPPENEKVKLEFIKPKTICK